MAIEYLWAIAAAGAEKRREGERKREAEKERDEGGRARETVKGLFAHVATVGDSEDVATKGAKNEISASVERNRLRSLSSPRDYDFRFRLRQRCAIPADVIALVSRSAWFSTPTYRNVIFRFLYYVESFINTRKSYTKFFQETHVFSSKNIYKWKCCNIYLKRNIS